MKQIKVKVILSNFINAIIYLTYPRLRRETREKGK